MTFTNLLVRSAVYKSVINARFVLVYPNLPAKNRSPHSLPSCEMQA